MGCGRTNSGPDVIVTATGPILKNNATATAASYLTDDYELMEVFGEGIFLLFKNSQVRYHSFVK